MHRRQRVLFCLSGSRNAHSKKRFVGVNKIKMGLGFDGDWLAGIKSDLAGQILKAALSAALYN